MLAELPSVVHERGDVGLQTQPLQQLQRLGVFGLLSLGFSSLPQKQTTMSNDLT